MADVTKEQTTTTTETTRQEGNQIPSGFLDKMLGQMHPFAASMIGSFLGFAVSFILVLKIGGMDVPFSRILNAYATGVEAQMTRVVDTAAEMTKKINAANDTLTAMQENLQTFNVQLADTKARLAIVETTLPELSQKLDAMATKVDAVAADVPRTEARVEALASNIEELQSWACEHERRVKTTGSFGPLSACDGGRIPRP